VTFTQRVRVLHVRRLTPSLVHRSAEGHGRPGGVEQAGFKHATLVYSRRVAGGPGPRGLVDYGPLSGRRHAGSYISINIDAQLGQIGPTPYAVSSC